MAIVLSKRFFCVISFCVLLLGTTLSYSAHIGFEKFERDGRYGLRDSAGVEIVPPVYDALGWSNDAPLTSDVFGYMEQHRWGLMTSKGKKITEPIYYGVYPFEVEGLYKVGVTGKFTNDLRFGLVDSKGKLVLSCHYFSLHPSDGNVIASIYEHHAVKYGVLGPDYLPKIPIGYREIKRLGSIYICRGENRKWSFFDSRGVPLIAGSFDSFRPWKGHLLVERKGARGLIDWKNERVALDPIYKEIRVTDTLEAEKPKLWSVYNRQLKMVMEVEGDSVSQLGELLVVYLNGAQKLFADSLEILPEVDFEVKYSGKEKTITKRMADDRWLVVEGHQTLLEGDSIYFDGNYFYVRNADTWDVYNEYRRKINDFPLEGVAQAVDLYVPAKRTGQWGLLDYQGKTIIGFAYDSLSVGVGLTFPARYVGSWGVLDVFGEWVISPAYEHLEQIADLYVGSRRGVNYVLNAKGKRRYYSAANMSLGNESLVISDGDQYGLISSAGQVIFDPIYQQVVHMGDYFVGHREDGIVVKDAEGEFVLTVDHAMEEVWGQSEGFLHIEKNGMHGFVDMEGRLRVANRYDSARTFHEGMAAIKLIGKWGFINKDERLVVQPYYHWVSDFSDGLAIVSNGKYGLIDRYGDYKFELDYQHIERTSAGTYIITDRRGRQGLASADGDLVLSPSYEEMEDIGSGYIVAARNGKRGIYDHSGKLLVSFVHEEILPLPSYILIR